MLKVAEISARSIITKSGLPEADFVINPYVGCTHKCIYCYAEFMKRFTNHTEEWGDFLDVKINAVEVLPKNLEKYRGKSVFLSSVTDPYLPLEHKYQLTRQILEKLISVQPKLGILTKSDLITRDIDLLQQFEDLEVGVSLGIIDDQLAATLERGATLPSGRIAALKKLHQAGLKTYAFLSPLWPGISDWKKTVELVRPYVGEVWFENLNVRPANWGRIKRWLKQHRPDLIGLYEDIYFRGGGEYWEQMEGEIRGYEKKEGMKFKIYFHHQAKTR